VSGAVGAGGERVRRSTGRGRSDVRGHHRRDRVPDDDVEHDERRDPGDIEGWSTNSYETHPWRVRDAASNDLLLEIMPLVGDTMLTVQ